MEKIKNFFVHNARLLLSILGLCLICFVVFYSYLSYKKDKEIKVSSLLVSYDLKYDDFVTKKNETDWVDSLDAVKKIGEENSQTKNGQRALYMVAMTYYKKNELDKAKELLQQLVDNDISVFSQQAIYSLAIIKEEEDRAQAIQLLEKFVKSHKDSYLYPKVVLSLGRNYIAMKNYKKASEVLTKDMKNFEESIQLEIKKQLAYISVNE